MENQLMMKMTRAAEKSVFYRSFELDRAQVDEEKRAVSLSFSSETPYMRWFGAEILLHGDKNVDLSRLKSMGAGLLNHNPSIIVGPIRNVRVEDKKGRADLVFDDDADGNKALAKVKSGSLRGVSVGYMINKFREVRRDEEYELEDGRKVKGPAYVAIRWTPYEISLTPIPADATVGVGRSLDGIEIERSTPLPEEEITMTEEQIRKLIEDALKAAVPTIVSTVRATIAEESRPKMNVTVEQSRELLARAGAVSIEVKAAVADMVNDGKTEPEILRFITDKATGKTDAADAGNLPNGTGRTTPPPKGQFTVISSFKQLDDDAFFRGIQNPAMMPLQ